MLLNDFFFHLKMFEQAFTGFSVAEKALKQEAILQDEVNSSQDGGGETQSHEMEETSAAQVECHLYQFLKLSNFD